MADSRIELAFAAIQDAHTEAHKTDTTAACISNIALARRLLSKYIDTQPAQAVDVDAVREVIAEMQIKAPTVKPAHLDNWAGRLTRALSGEKAGPVGGWISVEERRPERNKPAIYWHKSEFGGFAAIADEWRDEHHLEYATHWMPYVSPTPDKEG